MEYKALYRKYRPSKFNDVVGQDAVVAIIKNSIISNKIGHAFLFSGGRGTGKTSVAKILANTVNCQNTLSGEKCGKCTICKQNNDVNIDVIEIDAASNNGVDEIREIRNNAKLLPNICKYKVYIVDEVHMLSSSAFNALLKTLEEPPAHVIFILATTEIQKIPLTILSRCQKFEFKKITETDIIKRLKFIAKKEEIDIENEAIELIAQLSEGGLRDAINLLDQASTDNSKTVTVNNIYEISGIVSKKEIDDFKNNLLLANTKKILEYIDTLSEKGKDYKIFCEQLVKSLRNDLLEDIFNKKTNNKKMLLIIKKMISLINELKNSINQKILFEITLLEIVENMKEQEEQEFKPDIVKISENAIPDKEQNQLRKQENVIEETKNSESNEDNLFNIIKIRINNTLAEANKVLLKKLQESHDEISNYISNKKYNNIANMLLNAKLIVASPTHLLYELKNNSAAVIFKNNIELIEEMLEKIYNKKYKVTFLVQKDWENEKKKYLENKKKKIEYVFIDETDIKLEDQNTNFEKEAINIFGKETITKS